MEHLLLLAIALFAVIHGAQFATHYSEKIAEGFHLSRYFVGFIIVSFISILPETFIAVNAALIGDASFGLGALLGSNLADLTLVFAILAFVAGKGGVKIEKTMLKKLIVYPFFLMISLILGADGHFSRPEGMVLIVVGVIFYLMVFNKSIGISSRAEEVKHVARNSLLFILSMILLLAGAHFTVEAAGALAGQLGIEMALIGVLVVGLGTIIPELSFSIKAIKNKKHSLAIGNILGAVLADATIVVGLVAVIHPFSFPERIIYIAGGFAVLASILLLLFFKTGYSLKRRDALLLVMIWIIYITVEIVANI